MGATKERKIKASGSVTYIVNDSPTIKCSKSDFVIKTLNSTNIILKEVI